MQPSVCAQQAQRAQPCSQHARVLARLLNACQRWHAAAALERQNGGLRPEQAASFCRYLLPLLRATEGLLPTNAQQAAAMLPVAVAGVRVLPTLQRAQAGDEDGAEPVRNLAMLCLDWLQITGRTLLCTPDPEEQQLPGSAAEHAAAAAAACSLQVCCCRLLQWAAAPEQAPFFALIGRYSDPFSVLMSANDALVAINRLLLDVSRCVSLGGQPSA